MVSDAQSFNDYTGYRIYRTEAPAYIWSVDPATTIPIEPGTRKIGTIEITFELIKKLLGIDQCHKILNIWVTTGANTGTFNISVESENLEEVPEGATAPKVSIEKVN